MGLLSALCILSFSPVKSHKSINHILSIAENIKKNMINLDDVVQAITPIIEDNCACCNTPAPCYEDNPQRILPYAFIQSDLMTIEMCKEHCFVKNNYKYAGVEFYNECFCGNDKPDESLLREPEECDAPCVGNDQEICGGTWRINVYQNWNNV